MTQRDSTRVRAVLQDVVQKGRRAARDGVKKRRADVPLVPPTPREAAALASMGLLALLIVVFLLEVTLVGAVRHARAQDMGYDVLRTELARATAPVSQTDELGRLVALGHPVALLEVPSIGLREVVGEGTSSSVLASGPGHRRDTPMPGQAGTSLVYGRQSAYGGPFGDLDQVNVGDVVRATTGQGVQRFVVRAVRSAGDTGTAVAAGGSRITLVTAEGPPFLAHRVLRIDADLVGKAQPTPGRAFGSAALPPGEDVMGSDQSALLPLLLWTQGLLVAAVAWVMLRSVWGRWQTWVVAVPVLTLLSLQVAHQAAMLLPNLL